MINVKRSELINPPINAHARPDFHSAPELVERAIGIMANIIVNVVIKIGLILILTPSINASKTLSPCARIKLVRSTKRIAFLATSPVSIMIPSIVNIFNAFNVKPSANNAPIIASGIENKITNGRLIYIDCISFNENKKELTLRFVENPEHRTPSSVLIFHYVTNYKETKFEDYDPKVLENLIGLDEKIENDCIQYTIETDNREIILKSNRQPVLHELLKPEGNA